MVENYSDSLDSTKFFSPGRSDRRTGRSIRLDNNANEMATKKTWPNNRSGSNPDRFKTANPPAVVIAAPAIALPVVTVVLETQTSGVLRGLACLSSSYR